MTKFYKKPNPGTNWPIEVGFTFQKELIFDSREYDNTEWKERLDRLQSQKFNRIKIPHFTYEMIDNKIFFDVEFIKGRQLGIIDWLYWSNIIREDLVECNSDWGFVDILADNFVIERSTNTLFLVDFYDYRLTSKVERISSFERLQKLYKKEIEHLLHFYHGNARSTFWKP